MSILSSVLNLMAFPYLSDTQIFLLLQQHLHLEYFAFCIVHLLSFHSGPPTNIRPPSASSCDSTSVDPHPCSLPWTPIPTSSLDTTAHIFSPLSSHHFHDQRALRRLGTRSFIRPRPLLGCLQHVSILQSPWLTPLNANFNPFLPSSLIMQSTKSYNKKNSFMNFTPGSIYQKSATYHFTVIDFYQLIPGKQTTTTTKKIETIDRRWG